VSMPRSTQMQKAAPGLRPGRGGNGQFRSVGFDGLENCFGWLDGYA
jgi:hypothetical protein